MTQYFFLIIFLLFQFVTLQMTSSYANDYDHEKRINAFVKRVLMPAVIEPNSNNIQCNQKPLKKK